MSYHPESGGEIDRGTRPDEWPVHYYETEDGLCFELTLDTAIVREYEGERHLDHIYYLGNKVIPGDVEPTRLYGNVALRQLLIQEGFHHYRATVPPAEERRYYELFQKTQIDKMENGLNNNKNQGGE